jgi:voltage-gated sodium channel
MTGGAGAEAAAVPSWRERLGTWVEAPAVQNTIIALIVINAVALGLETSDTVMAHASTPLRALEHAILAVFVVEIGLKLIAFGLRFFRSPWNVFDFTIVAIALVPASGPFAILRALRILRVLRLIAKVPRLRRLIEALLRALPSIGWIVFLLGLVFYIFGVMGTELFGEAFPQFFGTLGRTMYTLFQIMTLESWSMAVARPVLAEYPFAWVYFVTFILITAFTVLNLFIGIIVNTMQEGVHADDVQQREQIEARAHAERAEMIRMMRDMNARLERMEGRDGAVDHEREDA